MAIRSVDFSSVPVGGVASALAMVRFTVLGQSFVTPQETVAEVVAELFASREKYKDKPPLIFSDITVFRSPLTKTGRVGFQQSASAWSHEGPFTPEQFLRMMDFKDSFPHVAWVNHLNLNGPLSRL